MSFDYGYAFWFLVGTILGFLFGAYVAYRADDNGGK